MTILIIGLVALLLGYMLYSNSRFIEGIVKPFRETTPAYSRQDGMDYVLSLCIASVMTFITVLAYIRDVLREPGAAVTSG